MSYLINNQQRINDIIFTDRNKTYGAYAIRSAYGNTVLKSLLMMMSSIALFAATAYYLSNRSDMKTEATVKPEILIIKDFVYEPKTKEEPKANPGAPKNNSGNKSNAISTNIADTASVHTSTVTVDIVSTGTGSTSTGTEPTNTGTLSSNGTGSTIITFTKTNSEPVYFVDSEPEFEGGIKALYKFLADNLRYPEDAKEAGVEGTMHIKFVVDKDGKVCNIEPQNKIGFGIDREAFRVASLIPNFKKPGMVKGEAVKVYYQLPIKFKLR